MMTMTMWTAIGALAIGMLSMVAYARRRRWIEALLAAVAALALAGLAGADLVTLPGTVADTGSTLTLAPAAWDAGTPPDLNGVTRLRLQGDGLRAAQWRDLPALPLDWKPPDTPALRLDFPSAIALGRIFTLRLERSWQAPGKLQLLAENGQVLAEDKGSGPLAVQWLPPLAENLVLRARLFDGAGRLVDEGPVPLRVTALLPLQVRGRFGAPSFDLRALDDLLAGSGAVIDWQVELGKALSRSETARAPMTQPDLEIVDAAWFEHAGDAARAAVLARVAEGGRLLVLGANAADAGLWSRSVGLQLRPQPADRTVGALALASAAWNPNETGTSAGAAAAWSGAGGIWTRGWRQGRIGWLGVGGWHRLAIAEPRRLALWWQDVLDRLDVRRRQDLAWLDPDEMPLPRQRLALCARGDGLAQTDALTFPALGQALPWQRRADLVDAACVALWPRRSGWLAVQARRAPQSAAAQAAREGTGQAVPEAHAVYVYRDGDWPLWQRAQRRDATLAYAARTPAPATSVTRPLPAWPFGVVFAFAMLGLWWRERR